MNSQPQHFHSHSGHGHRHRPHPGANGLSDSSSSKVSSGNRAKRIEQAAETMVALGKLSYSVLDLDSQEAREHDISEAVAEMIAGTILFEGDELSDWESRRSAPPRGDANSKMIIEFVAETTLQAARRCTAEASAEAAAEGSSATSQVCVLSFASAKKPGGGFLTGALAQEESLARSSALYLSLTSSAASPFYSKPANDCFYTDTVIYSPSVPVFRSDDATWTAPYIVSFVTCAAVNAGVARTRVKDADPKISEAMVQRMGRVLRVMELRGHDTCVLGNFGCGVFQNDLPTVVRIWRMLLTGRFRHSFRRVVFAVLSERDCKLYRDEFQPNRT